MTQRMTIVTWLTPSKLAPMGLNGKTKYAYANNAISEQKKQDTKLLPITSPNVNRFSKFFHWQTHW